MSAVKLCVICERPLDDDGKRRRRDAVTCSASCRTALWRARRRIRREGGVPGLSVTGDGYGTLTSFEPPASPGESLLSRSQSDDRFHSQLSRHQEAVRPLTEDERRERARLRDHMRRNPGVLIKPLHDRLIANGRKARAMEEAESHHPGRIAVQDAIHNPDPTVIARRGIASRNANRHLTADPNSFVDQPYTGPPSGPPRYPEAPEAEMIDAPWRRGRW
jgi:hypothetical protein